MNIVLFACLACTLYILLYPWDAVRILHPPNKASAPSFSASLSVSRPHRDWARRQVCPPAFSRPCGWTAAQTACPLHWPPWGTYTPPTSRWHMHALRQKHTCTVWFHLVWLELVCPHHQHHSQSVRLVMCKYTAIKKSKRKNVDFSQTAWRFASILRLFWPCGNYWIWI